MVFIEIGLKFQAQKNPTRFTYWVLIKYDFYLFNSSFTILEIIEPSAFPFN
jgi:hypothetical protein